ncbi:MAG: M48 family metallopeptidase [Bacteroidaceae bacterium]|nr:M48 family metallopeptidase [Bacteroidaceae bacterium]MBR3530533.1 M48 family metallopeptidase [Bacteroidaceae bacterium]
MKSKRFISRIMVVLAAIILASCGTTSTVPITGRKHKLLVDDAQMLSLSSQEYTSYMKTAKASTDATKTAQVKRVGQRLATAVETYLRNNGFAAELNNFKWEFNLVQDKSANAFCMPGGKIVVYEGILPLTQTDEGLAIVLGHEIAHAVAKHSAEQMSKEVRAQYGGQILSGVLAATGVNANTTNTVTSLYGLGSSLGQLHYSRSNESEADWMGLVFAAMAGYDPNYALTFWQRMAQSSQNSTPEFLSSHPSDAQRISDIQKHLPEALQYYRQATGTATPATTTSKKSTKSSTKSTTKKSKTGYSFSTK